MNAIDPTLGRIPRVMVPVQVDAMVLRVDTGGFADCRMRPPDPTGPPRQQPTVVGDKPFPLGGERGIAQRLFRL